MELGDGLKKLLLAGVGTVAVTAEKSREILDELVKKGELTVEQGKVLNQELKHNIKETINRFGSRICTAIFLCKGSCKYGRIHDRQYSKRDLKTMAFGRYG